MLWKATDKDQDECLSFTCSIWLGTPGAAIGFLNLWDAHPFCKSSLIIPSTACH